MKAWYVIGFVTALIPLYFRTRRTDSAESGAVAAVALDDLGSARRVFLWALLGAIGVLVYAWTATPPT